MTDFLLTAVPATTGLRTTDPKAPTPAAERAAATPGRLSRTTPGRDPSATTPTTVPARRTGPGRTPTRIVSPLTVPAVTNECTREVVVMTWTTTNPTQMVLSLVGKDRPGLMAELTEKPKEYGLTIETAMGRTLGITTPIMGMMMVVSGRPERIREFGQEVDRIRETIRATEAAPAEAPLPTVDLIVKVFPDRPGVVYDLSHAAVAAGLNITAFAVRTCTILDDPDLLTGDSGDATPKLGVTHIRVAYPTAGSLAQFKADLAGIPNNDTWEWTWKDSPTTKARITTPTATCPDTN